LDLETIRFDVEDDGEQMTNEQNDDDRIEQLRQKLVEIFRRKRLLK
jgi:hypothetical protein